MAPLHGYVGWSIVIAFALLTVYGTTARLTRRESLGRPFWGLLYYSETVLVIQVVLGVVLLLLGRRIGAGGFHLHYVYGSVFPLIVLVAGRLYALRREVYDYVPITFGAFVNFGLTARALMTGLGIG
ncbi:MAG: hypothetical protein ACRDUY_10945 [Nitriliruptorales bacterium]